MLGLLASRITCILKISSQHMLQMCLDYGGGGTLLKQPLVFIKWSHQCSSACMVLVRFFFSFPLSCEVKRIRTGSDLALGSSSHGCKRFSTSIMFQLTLCRHEMTGMYTRNQRRHYLTIDLTTVSRCILVYKCIRVCVLAIRTAVWQTVHLSVFTSLILM